MQTIAELAAAYGWHTTVSGSAIAGLTRTHLEHDGHTIFAWHDSHGRMHCGYLYRGDDIDPYATTGDAGVVTAWVTAHGTAVAA